MTKSYCFSVLGGCLTMLLASQSANATSMQMSIESQIDPMIHFVLNIDYERQGNYVSNNAVTNYNDNNSVVWANGDSFGCGQGGNACYDYFLVELVKAPTSVNNLPPPVFDEGIFGNTFDEIYSGMEYTEGMGSFTDTYLAAGAADNLLYLEVHQSGFAMNNIAVGYMFENGGWDGQYADELFLTVTSITELTSPVPEPSTMLMFVVGFFGIIGGSLRAATNKKDLTRRRLSDHARCAGALQP